MQGANFCFTFPETLKSHHPKAEENPSQDSVGSRCGKVHPHNRRPTILAIQHWTQHNGSRILGRKKRCVCGWKLPTNRIYDCLPLFLLRAQAIARPPARALAARIAGELLDCTYATAQRNMKCTPQLPLKFSNEKSCICWGG